MAETDGQVIRFGNATWYGSLPDQGLVSAGPVTSIVATPDGHGYWIVGSNGSVSEYGDAAFLGSVKASGDSGRITGAFGA